MKNRWSNYNLTLQSRTILWVRLSWGVELFSGQGAALWFGRAIFTKPKQLAY